MSGLLPLALVLLAETSVAPTYGPAPPPPPKPPASVATAARDCTPAPTPGATEIVICAVKPDGYRLNPDVMEARRIKKKGSAGRPRSPHETYADHSCATVGPMGCRGGPALNVVAMALTAAQMADRLAKGQEVGSLLVTDPQKSEYQLYVEAKKRREEKEADAQAKALSAQAQQAAAQSSSRQASSARPASPAR